MNTDNTVIVEFRDLIHGTSADLEIPLEISAEDLITALNTAFDLGISETDYKKRYLRSERPIALLKGHKILKNYGLRNGTIIFSPLKEGRA